MCKEIGNLLKDKNSQNNCQDLSKEKSKDINLILNMEKY